MKYILGIDLGESSLGWAVIRIEKDAPRELVDAGVRVFPAGAEIEAKKIDLKTKNAERRTSRGSRRVKERRARRKTKVLHLLQRMNLLPKDEAELRQVFNLDPYLCRARALDEKLAPFELGRAFYHLAQRRGFKSNRKSEKEKKDSGDIAKAIGALTADMATAKSRTVGEYFSLRAREPFLLATAQVPRIRKQHTCRSMYEEEFASIWERQAKFHADLLTPERQEDLRQAIFFQRPFEVTEERRQALPPRANALRAPQLADCSLIPGEKRCAVGSWIAQQFRLLKEVNNLRLNNNRGESRALTVEEREKILHQLSRQKEMKFTKMRKMLGVPDGWTFNLEAAKRLAMKGNLVDAALIKAFSEDHWQALREEDRELLRRIIVEEEDPGKLADCLRAFPLEPEKIADLQGFSAPDGYLRFSAKAMEILLPYLEAGLIETDAIDEAKKDGKLQTTENDQVHDLLPKPPTGITNPLVRRCLTETRRVVNALIREYGKPERIVVELARQLKMNRDDRDHAVTLNRDNEARNKIAEDWYKDHGRANPKNEDKLRFRLWQDQHWQCPYTGKAIGAADLLSIANVVEVDHILPFSRSLDNGYENKVLAFTEANREKGNRTPFEWKNGPDGEAFQEMIVRISEMSFSHGKKKRFSQAELDADEAIDRRLVDTQYASRELADYLNLLYPKELRVGQRAVLTTPGRVTAILRRRWGLNLVLGYDDGEKNREDHRHHAVDAVVIGCTSRKAIKALSDAVRRDDDPHQVPLLPPWEGFRENVVEVICRRERVWQIGEREIKTTGLLVSHVANTSISGLFHKLTNYGPTSDSKEIAYRVKVNELTGAMVEEIPNDNIKKIILDHIRRNGGDPNQKGLFPKKIWETCPQLPISEKKRLKNPALPESIPIRKVRIHQSISSEDMVYPLKKNIKDSRKDLLHEPVTKPYRVVKPGNNHEMSFFEKQTKNGKAVWTFRVTTTMEAARRKLNNEPIGSPIQENDGKLVMSLQINEMIVVEHENEQLLLRVQKICQDGRIDFRHHVFAGTPSESHKPPIHFQVKSEALRKRNAVKVMVDPLGRLLPFND
ncbi:MAG: type II CRISPR RNA-guided endonuclease Cas9 [Myxococcales bacterium]|nr:type II CRISPR RNA-guided endonuclease Cas9 [Myxococcales bacterium]